MGSASNVQPDRWEEARLTLAIHLEIPTRAGLGDEEEFDCPAAAARTAQADTPVVPVVTREYEVSPWQPRG